MSASTTAPSATCAGLYTVNQDACAACRTPPVLELFRRGYLQLIYLMIASLKQVPVLAQKKNGRLSGSEPERAG